MVDVLERIHARAAGGGARIALAEGTDERVVAAAAMAAGKGLCRPLLVGDADAVRAAARGAGVDLERSEIPVLDPAEDPRLDAMADALRASLDARGIPHDGVEAVRAAARDPLWYADLLVRHDRADGAVMGAVATTTETLRAALRVIGVDPRFRVVTSCFLMVLPDGRALIYADCGVIPTPDAEQLADIAIQAAETYSLLVGGTPRVALLAFSTKGSAEHPSLRHVRAAVELLAERVRRDGLDLAFDGELQADAALVPAVAARKAPGSPAAGRANVLVFPDLNSGNIAYKLTERLAQARAIGPLLQGLDRPVHDLSRGCSSRDVLDAVAIAALDAARRRRKRS